MKAVRVGTKMHDLVYGDIELTSAEVLLLRTGLMSRLQGVHMAIPARFLKTPASPTRFDHSCGVAHLAKLVAQLPDFADLGANLICAAYAHDAATPPFGHTMDPLLERCLKMDHEERACELIEDEYFSRMARSLGAELSKVKELLRGSWFRGAPDLDNADNTLRYGIKMGLCERMYDPRHIARAYCLVDGRLCLKPGARSAVQGWGACRQRVYQDFVYAGDHQAPYLMLRRAVGLVLQEKGLPDSFFDMTDREAYDWLQGCGVRSALALLRLAEDKLYHWRVHCSDETIGLLKSIDPLRLADDIAAHFKLSPEKICVGFGTNRGQKPREIPFTDELGTSGWPLPRTLPTWKLFVFAARDVVAQMDEGKAITPKEISDYVAKRIDRSFFIPSAPLPTPQPVLV